MLLIINTDIGYEVSVKSIKKHNVVDIVYEQIKKNICDGIWSPGSKIPSEPDLTSSLDVSRVSVRSAIQKLRDLGVVVTYHGKGTYVSENFNKSVFDLTSFNPIMHLSKDEFFDMLIFRETVEFKCIELAVKNATEEDLKSLELALNQMLIHKDDYVKYSRADFDFHYAIVKASKNKVFFQAMMSIKDMYLYYLEEINRVFGITLDSVDAHLKIYQAIKNRDASMAITVLNKAMSDNVHVINRRPNDIDKS